MPSHPDASAPAASAPSLQAAAPVEPNAPAPIARPPQAETSVAQSPELAAPPPAQPPAAAEAQTPPLRPAPQHAAAPQAPATAPTAAFEGVPPNAIEVPIPESTRRFLTPLVGVDPTSVRVFEAPPDSPLTTGADAVTLSPQAVVLATGNADQSPEALGLLAHELTHAARAREPEALPPVIEAESAAPTAEEPLAREVEARVIAAAESSQTASAPLVSAAPEPPEAPPQRNEIPSADSQEESSETGQQFSPTYWRGLPAPWEPLPEWMTVPWPLMPSGNGNGNSNTNGHAADTAAPVTTPSAPAASAASAPAAGAQFAETTRSLPPTTTQQSQSAEHQQPQPVEPDLDALAQQVYTILKRRISAERRRFN